jgi:hypothetical protein
LDPRSQYQLIETPPANDEVQCLEISKTTKAVDKTKSQTKPKSDKTDNLTFDYHEASIHDTALKADLLRGYERFKVKV